MLHRIKKAHDVNRDKWIGVGGKFKDDETPEECLLREVREETGLTLLNYRFRGILTFIADGWESEYIHLFTADKFEGTLTDCREGHLEWVPKDRIEQLPIWEGDKRFRFFFAETVIPGGYVNEFRFDPILNAFQKSGFQKHFSNMLWKPLILSIYFFLTVTCFTELAGL